MSITCRDIADLIENSAPVHIAEDWDNVGLLLGSYGQEIKRILICLDVTSEVVREACENKIDMIISHHPLIFKGIKRINEQDFKGRIIHNLIKNNISVYSAHTNLDAAKGGVNEQLAKVIGLSDIKNLKELNIEMSGAECGLGRVGFLEKPQELHEFIENIKNKLGINTVKVVGSAKGKLQKVGVFCGSFDEDYSGIFREKIDVLVTSDIKYHTAVDMIEMGLCAIDAGHFNTERIFAPAIEKMIKDNFPMIEVFISKMERDPFIFS